MGDPHEGTNAAIQRDVTVRILSTLSPRLGTELLEVYRYENHRHYKVRKRGFDCHLSDPN